MKTHDPFAIVQYFSGSLGLHVASLIILSMRLYTNEDSINGIVKENVMVLLFANIVAIVGILGNLYLKIQFKNASEK